jgi:hypothetical protein
MIPMPNAADRAVAKVTMQSDVDVGRITKVEPVGQHLAVTFVTDRRIGGEYPVRFNVEANGKTMTAKATVVIKHAQPKPFGLTAVIGSSSTAEIPFTGQLWKAATYKAHLEPPTKQFRLTANKGTMEAGMKKFPFRVVFAPKEARSCVVLLVVVFNETEEYTIEITGSVGGFQGRSWAKRQGGGLTASLSGNIPRMSAAPSSGNIPALSLESAPDTPLGA